MNKIDLHVHSNNSDGTDSVEELITNLKKSNIEVFALTDHDTINGISKIEKLVPPNIKFIKGIEFSCSYTKNKIHILGLNINEKDSQILSVIETEHDLRKQKLEIRLKFLKDKYGIIFTDEELSYLRSIPNCGTAHLATILINRKTFEGTMQDVIKKYLNSFPTDQDRLNPKLAIDAIHSAGGLAIWAHPLGGENETHYSKEDFLNQLNELRTIGIDGIECFYSRYSKKEEEFLFETASKFNLVISAGSDYHGKNKTISLGELNNCSTDIDLNKISILKKII